MCPHTACGAAVSGESARRCPGPDPRARRSNSLLMQAGPVLVRALDAHGRFLQELLLNIFALAHLRSDEERRAQILIRRNRACYCLMTINHEATMGPWGP